MNQAVIKQYLSYNPETGIVVWARDVGAWGRIKAGTEAGTVRSGHGYRAIQVRGNLLLAHRLVFILMNQEEPKEVDHINGDKLDNRWCNLRAVTRKENSRNQRARNPESGYLGVYEHKGRTKPWQAKAMIDGKTKSLGYYRTAQEAAIARKQADVIMGFHTNHGRRQANG